ncbi:hypothetical protein HSX11_09815 [Oxalobacteraceae bacterium]|nr:hypothetical protein [Oxalobacteraceae bacterium]
MRTSSLLTWAAAVTAGALLYLAWPASQPADSGPPAGHLKDAALADGKLNAHAAPRPAGARANGTGSTDATRTLSFFDTVPTSSPEPGIAPLPNRLLALERSALQLRQQGASSEIIERLRADTLSADESARLAEREQAEAAWLRRVQEYQSERARLSAAGQPADAADKALRAARFTAEEQTRLAAYAQALPQLKME